MASTTEDLGESDGNHPESPLHTSLEKQEQTIMTTPQGSPRSQRSDFSTQSATSSAASFDLAGRIKAFDCAHTLVGNLGRKDHGVGSPMHSRNRSSGSNKKSPSDLNENRDDGDDKFNTGLNGALSMFSKERNHQTANSGDKESVVSAASRSSSSVSQRILHLQKTSPQASSADADKESVVSSASRISSLSQAILQLQNEKASSADKDSVVSSASRISSLSQKIIQESSNDNDRDSDNSVVSSASLIASLSNKILQLQKEEASSDADKDSVLSSASLISSLSQRILQRSSSAASPVNKQRPSFKSRSSQNKRASFERVEESTPDDKESSASSSGSQGSSVAKRIKALQKNESSVTSPRTSFASSASPRPSHSSFGQGSTTIDRNSMTRIQARIKELQSSAITSPRPPRPSFANRTATTTMPSPNPQEASRSSRPLPDPSSIQRSQPAEKLDESMTSPTSVPPTETMETTPQNISEMTMDEDGDGNENDKPQVEVSLQNVSELSALADPNNLWPPTIERFPTTSADAPPPPPPKAGSHVSLPNPIAYAMDALRQYATTSTSTTPAAAGSTSAADDEESRINRQNNNSNSNNNKRPWSPDWLPTEHFAVAAALFPENQFDVNDGMVAAAAKNNNMENKNNKSLPEGDIPSFLKRSHSDGDLESNFGFDDHGFPKFLASQREPEDDDNKEIPHHIQFDSSRMMEEEEENRGPTTNGNIMERTSSWRELRDEIFKYNWKDKLPILMGCLLILIGIIVGISLAVSSAGSSDDELVVGLDDLNSAPSTKQCDYVENGYSIPGEESLFEVDLNWLLDVSLIDAPTTTLQLTTQVQELFQSKVLPTVVGCDSNGRVLQGQYLVVNGYVWSVREIGNCELGAPMPCSRLLVSFVLWTKERRDAQAMNTFCVANFGFDGLVNPMETGDDIRQVDLVSTVL